MTFATEADARAFVEHRPSSRLAIVPTSHERWTITSVEQSKRAAKICSICGEPFREYPCNAQPVNDGRCCAYCDDHVVTPARIREVNA